MIWPPRGIFPDVMHLVHLALAPDAITSMLLDWTDDTTYWNASSREKRLLQLWGSYREWCETAKVQDRAQKRLFSTSTLKSDGKYPEVNQKTLSATAARYMIHWLANVAKQYVASGDELDMFLGWVENTLSISLQFPYWS